MKKASTAELAFLLAIFCFKTDYNLYAQYKNMNVSNTSNLNGFADAASVESYAVDAMRWAVGSGIINGDSQNGVVPGNASSRAVVATMFYRFCN